MKILKSIEWRLKKHFFALRMQLNDFIQQSAPKNHPVIGLIDFIYPTFNSTFCDFEYSEYIKEFGNDRFASIWTGAGAENPEGMKFYFERSRESFVKPRYMLTNTQKSFRFVDAFYSLWFSCLTDHIERGHAKKFGFTLYPDESWQPSSQRTIEKLRRAFDHPGFTGVLCTQRTTVDFLESNFGKIPNLIFKHGVALELAGANHAKKKRALGQMKMRPSRLYSPQDYIQKVFAYKKGII